ncbi:MAG TPA: hypothetical protein VE650_05645, partial [Acetobacteraceae bacterium]|nr:hypothetical protein [Acetobacteraceae bacterium]
MLDRPGWSVEELQRVIQKVALDHHLPLHPVVPPVWLFQRAEGNPITPTPSSAVLSVVLDPPARRAAEEPQADGLAPLMQAIGDLNAFGITAQGDPVISSTFWVPGQAFGRRRDAHALIG